MAQMTPSLFLANMQNSSGDEEGSARHVYLDSMLHDVRCVFTFEPVYSFQGYHTIM